jgi:hypothetical protein
MAYPIILIHKGDSPYLAYAIAQAKSSNPNSSIILLGDKSNSYYLGVEHFEYQKYFTEAKRFAELYKYEFSPNYQYAWQLFCHQRHFILKEFCQIHGINKFVYIDSDVMIYENVDKYFKKYENYSLTLVCENPASYSAGAWFSIVQDLDIICDLCKTYQNLFSDSGKEIRAKLHQEVINDTIGLYLLLEENPNKVKNMYSFEDQDYVMHVSMEWDNRFEYDGKFLKVLWRGKTPFLIDKKTGNALRAPMLHFHGKGKYVMRKYLKVKNINILLQALFNRLINAILKYPRRIYKRITS